MMDLVQVDPRVGSGDLLPLLRERGVPAVSHMLQCGDVAFMGRGEEDRPVPVGVEIKSVGDLLKCISNGRFTGSQLRSMQLTYEVSYLLIEGSYREGDGGILEVPRGRGSWDSPQWGPRHWTVREVEHWINTIEIRGGMRIRRTYSRGETVRMLNYLYSWWTSKSMEEHRSHLQADTSAQDQYLDHVALTDRPLLFRFAAQLPGIGQGRAEEVTRHFRSISAMMDASVGDWMRIKGVGKVTAQKAYNALRG